MLTGHTFDSIASITQATGVLLIGIALTIIVILQLFFKKWLQKAGFAMSTYSIDVDENLPNFFEAVKLQDAEWAVYENAYLKE